ncbi:MAG: cysteine desulfurase NifS [Candidatus Zipacnadales bacterium]
MTTVYLDNNATTRVADEVLEEMLPYFSELYGNPSSMHFLGGQVARKLEEARGRVAELVGADPSEIVFTGCGSESNNTAIRSAVELLPQRRKIVTSRIEHPAILGPCRYFEDRGYEVHYLGVDSEGHLDLAQARATIDDQTALVSIMWANNETGHIMPVEAVAAIAKEHGALFHCDAVQAVGKVPVNLANSAIDYLSMSGHKFHGPKGVGALFIRRGTPFAPFLIGGHQERNRRAGTENTASIIGMGKAAELARGYVEIERTRVQALRDRLEGALLTRCRDAHRNGAAEPRLPNTTSISFDYVEGESILLALSDVGICASSGSACTSGSLEPSHVLRALGVPFTRVHGSLRLSLSVFTTDEEIDYVIRELPPIIERLRALSPFGH